eukprot:15478167-Alexandrium_andersonii.AAC.1
MRAPILEEVPLPASPVVLVGVREEEQPRAFCLAPGPKVAHASHGSANAAHAEGGRPSLTRSK